MRKRGAQRVPGIPQLKLKDKFGSEMHSPWFAKDRVTRHRRAKAARKANVKRLRQGRR